MVLFMGLYDDFVCSDKEKDLLNYTRMQKKGVSYDIKGKLIASYLADE